jgi:hypothetical protein
MMVLLWVGRDTGTECILVRLEEMSLEQAVVVVFVAVSVG